MPGIGNAVSAGRAEGEAGAPRALEILCDEVRRTMHLYGARSIDEVTPDLLA